MAKAKILGKLKGIIASARESSRNGRRYTEGFWDSKFNTDLFKEGLKNKMFFGQLYHPDDDNEYNQIHCDDRSAVVLTDVKKNGLDYEGTFEILPTKAGQCLRNLLDIGCVFGVSSRGVADYDTSVFDESIAPNYDLITWDIVAFPGVKCCRLHEVGAVAEGYSNFINKNKTKIMESLSELSTNDPFMSNYIDEALKAKESFDDELHMEDIMAKYNIPDDYQDYMKVVTVEEDGVPYYDDGTHGKLPVIVLMTKNTNFTPGDSFLVDDIVFNKKVNKYLSVGDWLKLD